VIGAARVAAGHPPTEPVRRLGLEQAVIRGGYLRARRSYLDALTLLMERCVCLARLRRHSAAPGRGLMAMGVPRRRVARTRGALPELARQPEGGDRMRDETAWCARSAAFCARRREAIRPPGEPDGSRGESSARPRSSASRAAPRQSGLTAVAAR
jgi:hypothetical protein